MYKKQFLNLLFWGDNRFPHLILMNYTQIVVYFDIKNIIGKICFEFFLHSAFLLYVVSFCHKVCKISVQDQDIFIISTVMRT
jgi:hypothetical protein